MQKKLTVTVDEEVYEGLRKVIGPRKISRFIEDLVRPHVVKKDMYAAYKEMADQFTTVSKKRLINSEGSISYTEMEDIGKAISTQLDQ